ncbi:hypothetical protein Krac_11472 [Ktedonobacter racemifer DSM 44963]|uniref:Uncharacterized protein n=1 Tax=Ktedonobacter racemifer DSM 44963 TaxID=485913 RepID=D6TBV4_KTERA|nr:hypothetical protein Krac_11472 [Ktedonobacter racemifer DSM 44963]
MCQEARKCGVLPTVGPFSHFFGNSCVLFSQVSSFFFHHARSLSVLSSSPRGDLGSYIFSSWTMLIYTLNLLSFNFLQHYLCACLQIKLESFRSCHCYRVVLLARTAANTYGTNNLPIPFKRNTTRKDHDPTIIGCVNAEKLPAGLGLCCQILRGNVESSCRKSFLNRDINTTDPTPRRVMLDVYGQSK